MNNGWVKLYRALLENPVFYDPHLLQIFIYCLLKANHKTEKIIYRGEVLEIPEGSFITGRHTASQELRLKGKMWDRKLEVLEKLEILTIRKTSRFSIITITKWQDYQGINTNNDQQMTSTMTSIMTIKRPANDQQMTTNKNDKNDKKYNPPLYNIPPFIKVGVWNEYIEMRKKIRKPMTEKAKELALKKLERFYREGQDPNAILEQSILNSWQGLFPVKQQERLPRFNEDTHFQCTDCKQIVSKAEREYGEDGRARCKRCYQEYLKNLQKEKEQDLLKAKEEWQRLSPEQKEKRRELFRKLNIPVPMWMGGEEK